MTVEFDRSFLKSLSNIKDKSILKRIKNIILRLENSDNLKDVRNIRKLTGFKTYYRIRIGDYRLGFESIDENTIRLLIVAHRKDIYRNFPK